MKLVATFFIIIDGILPPRRRRVPRSSKLYDLPSDGKSVDGVNPFDFTLPKLNRTGRADQLDVMIALALDQEIDKALSRC